MAEKYDPLPMCSICKKIRIDDTPSLHFIQTKPSKFLNKGKEEFKFDDGLWLDPVIDKGVYGCYIKSYEGKFSHGLCRPCRETASLTSKLQEVFEKEMKRVEPYLNP
ncbi:MAG: hypothetical protein ABIB79_02560 [archaeon]